MLNEFRQTQFALASHLRDPLSVPLPEGINAADTSACSQDMVDHLCAILAPAFPVMHALLGDDIWGLTVRLFLKDTLSHMPWATDVQRAFMTHVCTSAEMHHLPAWVQDLAHFEWLQGAVSATPVTWPAFIASGDTMHHVVVLNPTHIEAAYEWPVHSIDSDHKPDEMQTTYVTMLRDPRDQLHVFKSSVFRGQLIDLLREGQTGEQAFKVLATWLSHPEPEVFVHEGTKVMAQLQREGVVLGTRI